MTLTPLDELNTMSKPPEEYFGEMDLTQEQIDERIQFTEDANEELLDIMALIVTMGDYGAIDYDRIQRELADRWAVLISSYVLMDDYLRQYTQDYAENFTDATRRNIEDGWYLSEDRALYNAENAANDTLNYKEYIKAIEDGYTHKKWLTEHDLKVRPSHSLLHGQVIGIEEYFVVGGALMRFPKDYELAFDAPRELVNCRCVCRYINKGNKTYGDIVRLNANEIPVRGVSAAQMEYKGKVIRDDRYVDGNGVEYPVDGRNVILDPKPEEIATAELISRKYGVDVHLVPRVLKPKYTRTPDYIINGIRTDRKRIDGNSKNVLDNAVNGCGKQASDFVFVMGKTNLSLEELIAQSERLFESPYRSFVRKVYIEKDGDIVYVKEK